jgi:methyl-accepting chemotaxis protein
MVENFSNQLDSLSSNFSTLATEKSNKLETVQSSVDTISSDVLGAIAQKLVEEAVGELASSAEKFTEATSTLREAGEESNELLDGKLGDIIDRVDDVVEIIEDIKPVLDMVDSILG